MAGDASARKENALRNFSKMLGGAIPKFPSDAEVPVWFDTVECLFQRYGVPQEIQAHLVYPLVASRMSYLCASLNKEEQFTFTHIKEAVLKELRLTPREYRKKFLGATKRKDEGWQQFATRLASYLHYYLEARQVGSLEDMVRLLVADQLKSTLSPDELRYVTLREGNEWFRAGAIADLLAAHDAAEESHATLRKSWKQLSHPQGATQGAGKREGRFPLGKQGNQATSQCHKCGSPTHPSAECPKNRDGQPSGLQEERRVQRVATAEWAQTRLLAAKVASVAKQSSELPAVQVSCGNETLSMVLDSGSEITVIRESRVPARLVKPNGSITLIAAFGNRVTARLVTLPLTLLADESPRG